MGADGFGHDLDFHAGERLGCVHEPLHFGFLIRAAERGQVADFGVKKRFGCIHVGECRHAAGDQRKRHRGGGLS